ncbi:Bor/Iss family lipoprotein [Marinoscillum furvescens]|uniref:Bor protein n=1 Tax=Marinoscillum furvescens DSM 4134 TaxID=1122208 RepID=A0A3D9KXA3_MARFU|nr:hypothetical protein [Marinoscillum furvescens]RED91304.1 hypothetical protein C7460_1492 [Marinoscillum furvescens DSM 4134]
MKKLSSIAIALLIMLSVSSCYTMTHTVGAGAQGTSTTAKKQWYALWGLVPISNVDTKAMAGGASDYTITTQQSFGDGVIGMFTGIVTIQPRTVKVTK